MPLYYATISSPLGDMVLTSHGSTLNGLTLGDPPPEGAVLDRGRMKRFVDEVKEYLAGERQKFSFRVDQPGTDFQKGVWNELMKIPFGKTISYAELARRIGQPNASRAVGSANGKNQVAIVVPCHRVIASGGKLGGYGGGLWRKEWLLDLESRT